MKRIICAILLAILGLSLVVLADPVPNPNRYGPTMQSWSALLDLWSAIDPSSFAPSGIGMVEVTHGGTGKASWTVNALPFASAATTLGEIAPVNSAVVVTNGSGVPSESTDLPTAVTIGSAYVYRAGGTDVPFADGGTGLSAWTQYLIPYAATTTSIGQIAIGASGQPLVSAGAGAPAAFNSTVAVNQINPTGGTATLGTTATGANVVINATEGATIVSNGTFTTNLTGWTGANWTQSAGTALHTAGATTALTQGAATVTIGVTYKLTFDVVGGTAGTITSSFGGLSMVTRNFGSASYTSYGPAVPATTALTFTPTSTFDGAIDNVVLVAYTANTGSLTVRGPAVFTSGIYDNQGNNVLNIWQQGVSIGTASPATGYKLNVAGYINSSQTVDNALYPTVNAVQTDTVLQDGSASTGTTEQYDNLWEAIKFTASGNMTMVSFGVQLKYTTTLTNLTATITGHLYSDAAGSPNVDLGTVDNIVRYGTLTTGFVEYQFLIGSVALTSSTPYWLVLKQSVAPTGGTIQINTTNTGTALYANSANGTAWNLENSKTGWFKLRSATYIGVSGTSTNSNGVSGISTNSNGVQGTSTNSYGVQGTSTNSNGVSGISTNSNGVSGISTNSYGVQGSSTNANGVQGTSTNANGVYGISTNSNGVSGYSTNSTGVYGISTNSNGGVFYQGGTLTAANSVNTVLIRRYSVTNSTGSLNATGNVLQITDNPTGTGTISGSLIQGQINSTVMLDFNPRVLDGASAVAYMLDTKVSLADPGAKLYELRNGTVAKVTVLANGNTGLGEPAPSHKLDIVGDMNSLVPDNGVGHTIQINATQANITAADTFMDFRSNSGSEATIAGTAVPGVIAYNTFTGSHYTQIEDRTGLTVGVLLEIVEGKPQWKPILKTAEYVVEVNEPVWDANGVQIYEDVPIPEVLDTSVVKKPVMQKIQKLIPAKFYAASPKQQLFKSRICKTKGSKAAIGFWGGQDKEGRDLILCIGTGPALVANKGTNIEMGDFLQSSDAAGCVELQADGIYRNITVGKATESIVWETGETSRMISCILTGG